MKSHRLLFVLEERKKGASFEKIAKIMETKIKNKIYSRSCFLNQFHLLCANFRKIGWKIKKIAKFVDGPLS